MKMQLVDLYSYPKLLLYNVCLQTHKLFTSLSYFHCLALFSGDTFQLCLEGLEKSDFPPLWFTSIGLHALLKLNVFLNLLFVFSEITMIVLYCISGLWFGKYDN